jgi:hypothetical protein
LLFVLLALLEGNVIVMLILKINFIFCSLHQSSVIGDKHVFVQTE